jgi:hypothetical protein
MKGLNVKMSGKMIGKIQSFLVAIEVTGAPGIVRTVEVQLADEHDA